MITPKLINNIEVLELTNKWLSVSVVPALGGKILSVFNHELSKEFLWTNASLPLQLKAPGTDYDSNFIGGIDELIPNDIPQQIDNVEYPDHGELWTTPLDYHIDDDTVTVSGRLPLSQLQYSKSMRLDEHGPRVILNYRITNGSAETRRFLWKLHAASVVQAGDRVQTGAAFGQVADLAYSRFTDGNAFRWPVINDTDASVIPEKNNTMDFFYLYGTPHGEMHLSADNNNHLFGYSYDKSVFPYEWYFASYGAFLDHYVAVLEPCTTMPIDVNEAIEKQQCTVLAPGETLTTQVTLFAGPSKLYQRNV